MNSVCIFGTIMIAIGCMALFSSSSNQLKGDREYTFKSGFVITVIGLVILMYGILMYDVRCF